MIARIVKLIRQYVPQALMVEVEPEGRTLFITVVGHPVGDEYILLDRELAALGQVHFTEYRPRPVDGVPMYETRLEVNCD